MAGEEKRGDNGDKGREPGAIKALGYLVSMGTSMVVSTFIGLLIGIYLDRYFSTKPWFTIIFLLFGIAAGFRNIYRTAKRYGFKNDNDGPR
ncbi:MAG: AtpZ/AtpI family protein [Thermodesulfobacteriota bacterium]